MTLALAITCALLAVLYVRLAVRVLRLERENAPGGALPRFVRDLQERVFRLETGGPAEKANRETGRTP